MTSKRKSVIQHLESFKSILKQHFGERFSGLTLFGSYARDQAKPDSDVDLLLILKNYSSEKDDYRELLPLISGFLLESGVFISLMIKSENEMKIQKEGLLRNISVEGIRI